MVHMPMAMKPKPAIHESNFALTCWDTNVPTRTPMAELRTSTATASSRRYFEIMARRDELSVALERFLANYDAWLCPVTPAPAFAHRKIRDHRG